MEHLILLQLAILKNTTTKERCLTLHSGSPLPATINTSAVGSKWVITNTFFTGDWNCKLALLAATTKGHSVVVAFAGILATLAVGGHVDHSHCS